MPADYRQEILKQAAKFPMMRLGQFIENVLDHRLGDDVTHQDLANLLYSITDERLFEACKAYVTLHYRPPTRTPTPRHS